RRHGSRHAPIDHHRVPDRRRGRVPNVGAGPAAGDGATFTGEGYAPLFDPNIYSRSFVGRLGPGASPIALADAVGQEPALGPLAAPKLPIELGRLHEIDWLPMALAAVIGGLALLAVGHGLVTS